MDRTLLLSLLTACTCSLGCAAEDTFVDDHASDIKYDCDQTVACLSARGSSLSSHPAQDCLDNSEAELSDFSDHQRDVWKARVDHCAAFQACEYYDCTQSDTVYSQTHFAQIQYDCMSAIACRNSRGEMLPASSQNTCLTQLSVMLDVADATKRTEFEARFARCSMLQVCAYYDCK